MREESKEITLKLGNVRWSQVLGSYYIDMRPARVHYEKNIYDGGIDENGVPFIKMNNEKQYSPVNIAQYGFILHADFLETNDEALFNALKNCVTKLEELATIDDQYCIWWHNYDEGKYNIKGPWASAMSQGEGMSLFLRFYQLTNEDKYLILAKKAFKFLTHDISEKSVRVIDQNGDLWLEEYPSKPSSFVLNGFIYAVFGVIDLYRVTHDQAVKNHLDDYLSTLEKNIHRFDCGYWSYYDLLKKELVRYYYQKNVHAPQLEVLYLLTQKTVFRKYARKWRASVNPINFIFVQIMYRILPRWRAKRLFI